MITSPSQKLPKFYQHIDWTIQNNIYYFSVRKTLTTTLKTCCFRKFVHFIIIIITIIIIMESIYFTSPTSYKTEV